MYNPHRPNYEGWAAIILCLLTIAGLVWKGGEISQAISDNQKDTSQIEQRLHDIEQNLMRQTNALSSMRLQQGRYATGKR